MVYYTESRELCTVPTENSPCLIKKIFSNKYIQNTTRQFQNHLETFQIVYGDVNHVEYIKDPLFASQGATRNCTLDIYKKKTQLNTPRSATFSHAITGQEKLILVCFFQKISWKVNGRVGVGNRSHFAYDFPECVLLR